MSNHRLTRFVITALLPAVLSTIVGFVFFRRSVFQLQNSAFQFLAFGIVGGVVFAAVRYFSYWHSTGSLFLLFIVNEIITRSVEVDFMIRDAVYFIGFSGSVFIFAKYFFARLNQVRFGRSLALGSLVAVSYLLITLLLDVVFLASSQASGFNLVQMIYYNLSQGFLIGIGAGSGIELSELVNRKLLPRREQT